MWRRYGDALYTLLTLAIFGFETIALGVLSLAFLLGAAAGIASTPIEEILLAVVTSTASALALLGLYLLSYHFISSTRDRWHHEQVDKWTEWWVGLALAGPDEPADDGASRRRLPRVAVDSVLSLLEAVKGEEGDRLKEALAGRGVDRWFRAGPAAATSRPGWTPSRGSARPACPRPLTPCWACSTTPSRWSGGWPPGPRPSPWPSSRPSPGRTARTPGSSPPSSGPTSSRGSSRRPCCCWRPGPARSSGSCWPTPSCPTPCAGSS